MVLAATDEEMLWFNSNTFPASAEVSGVPASAECSGVFPALANDSGVPYALMLAATDEDMLWLNSHTFPASAEVSGVPASAECYGVFPALANDSGVVVESEFKAPCCNRLNLLLLQNGEVSCRECQSLYWLDYADSCDDAPADAYCDACSVADAVVVVVVYDTDLQPSVRYIRSSELV
jgi:hypothetical protein